jgi:hypothetical protein
VCETFLLSGWELVQDVFQKNININILESGNSYDLIVFFPDTSNSSNSSQVALPDSMLKA